MRLFGAFDFCAYQSSENIINFLILSDAIIEDSKSLIMTVQSENSLEQGLIRTLQENSYEYVEINSSVKL